jgi:hypothetical protein
MSPAPPVSRFKALASLQQPGVLLYDYSADEVGHCTNLYPTIQQWAHNMHEAGINNLVSISPVPALYSDGSGTGRSAVDIWVLLPLMYNKNKSEVAHVLQKGNSVWSYNTLVQDPYSPKWEIDFDPVNFRIQPGFINQSLNLTGLLYWRIDRWTSDPWTNVNNTGTYSSNNFPGEGMLVYPGQQVGIQGVVGSMRLKWLRDGVDDYEYLQILKSLGKGDLAMEIARSVGPDWTNWTRDGAAIDSARNQLGQAINQIMNERAPSAASGASSANVATIDSVAGSSTASRGR